MEHAQMQAWMFFGPGKIEARDVPIPEPGSTEMLLRMRAASVCGTDVRIYRGQKTRGVRIPSVLGHEFAGEIVHIGSEVEGFRIGDRVIVAPVIACGSCSYCRRGMTNVCLNRMAFGYEFSGGFEEYVMIPDLAIQAGNIVIVPPDLSFEEAAMIEPLSCCFHGQQIMPIDDGDSVLVIGAGPIGLMHSLLAKLQRDTTVIVSDPNPIRRQFAESLGADVVLDPSETDLRMTVLDFTDGLGVDKAILAASVPEIIGMLLGCIRTGGSLNLFSGSGVTTIDANEIHYRELRLSGSSASTIDDFTKVVSLVSSGRLDILPLLTQTFPLADFAAALDYVAAGKGLKSVLTA